jgi:hypothetical protein
VTGDDALGAHWAELVSVGLLGTDRRPVPAPPPGALAELAAEAPPPDAAAALIQQVAALTAVRRAGLRPRPAPAALAPPPADLRPATPPAAGEVLHQVLATWPILEDEWLERASAGGWRLAPELVAPLLVRHRGDPARRARVEALAGPLAAWLVDHLPQLAAARTPSPSAPVSPAELVLPAELAALPAADPAAVVRVVAGGVQRGAFGPAHRAVVELALARVRPDALEPLADALRAVAESGQGRGLAGLLGDLAHTRAALVAALPIPAGPHPRSTPG